MDGVTADSIFPVFIPSRGRSRNTKGTAFLLAKSRIPYTFVVEPHEAESYKKLVDDLHQAANEGEDSPASVVVGSVLALPLSHQGVSYVRNFILNEASPQHGWFWVMDDDIRRFQISENRVNKAISAREMHTEVCKGMQDHPTASLFSIDYPFYAWQYSHGAVAFNSYNNIAILVNRDRLPADISYRFRIREDYDFTLQIINNGGLTVRFRYLSFTVPLMAASPGGMTDYYETQKKDIEQQNIEFMKLWPSITREVIKGTKGRERLDINVKWILLHPKKTNNPAEILKSTEKLNCGPTVDEQREQLVLKEVKKGGKSDGGKSAPKRQRSATISASESENEEEEIFESEEEIEVAPARPRKPAPRTHLVEKPKKEPKPKPPPAEKHLPGWKGYTLEHWRDVSPLDAAKIGLELIPFHDVKIGHVVLMIPLSYDLPAVVRACILEVCRRQPHYEWSAVIEKVRGAPIQSVVACYRDSRPELNRSLAELSVELDGALESLASNADAETTVEGTALLVGS